MADDNGFRSLIPVLEGIIEGQKRTVASLAAVGAKYDEVQSGIDRLAKQMIRLNEGFGELKSDNLSLSNRIDTNFQSLSNRIDANVQSLTGRLDAILQRIEELEHQADRSLNEIRQMKIELVAQYNDVLNAMQGNLTTRSDLDDLVERVERIEAKLGL